MLGLRHWAGSGLAMDNAHRVCASAQWGVC